MAKLTAVLVTLIGVLMVLSLLEVISMSLVWVQWVVALSVLVIGIGKLMRNYGKKKRR